MHNLSRRLLLQSALAAPATLAQSSEVLPNVPYRNYARCLPDYLRLLAREAYTRRSEALAKLTSEAAIRERQRWVRETFWQLTGGQPRRTPLNARVTRSVERPGFRIDCVVFESQPNFHVSANLYLPTGQPGPFPGVLFQPGHSSNGKAYEGYQLCCQGLVKLGFAVLSLDPMGQGERTYYPGDIPWQSRLPGGADDEHTLPGKQMLLVGDTATRLQTWDAVRALDYLASRPEVDPARLASAGQSGGGTNTMLLAAVDDRIAAAVACCPNSENIAAQNFIPPGSTDDAEQNILFSGPLGFDRWDLLYPLAPKPLLVLVSSTDFAGTYSPNYIANGIPEFQRLRSVYRTLGHEDKLAWRDSLLPHGLSYDLRVHTYNFLRRWLQNKQDRLKDEPEVTALPDRELFASPNGNVVNAYKGETPATQARKRPQSKSNPVAALRDLLHLRPWPNAGNSKLLGETFFRHVSIEAHEVQSSEGVYLPVWLFRPRNTKATKTLLILDPAGRRDWREHGLYDQIARTGVNVCAADLRGIGHMAPEFSGGAANHARSHNSEQHYAWASLILGEPLPAQRVTDIQALVTFLQRHTRIAPVHLAARNILTTPALFATALDQRITALLLSGAIPSFRDVLEATQFPGSGYFTPPEQMGQDLFGAFLPNLLTKTDLPEIAATLAPRPLHLALRGVNGETITEFRFRELYGASSSVKAAPQSWSVAAFTALLA